MNIKRFKFVCRLLSILFKILAFFGIALLIIGLFFVFLSDTGSFNYDIQGFSLYVAQRNYIDDDTFSTAALIIAPLVIGLFVYVLFKGSALFDQLAVGQSPFNYEFSDTIKKISLILIIADILFPLLYSLVITLLTTDGHYLNISIGSSFIYGLILYAVAEIFNYGIELQKFSDDTI